MRIETGTARAAAGVIAIIGWAGLAVQLSAVIDQVGSVTGAIWVMLRYFTILTNVLAAAVFTGIALGQPFPRSQSLLGLMTLSTVFVGAGYVLLLRGLIELSGGAATANLILHYVVPGLAPLFWLLFAPKGALKWRDPVLWSIYPLTYFAYALVRGTSDGKYPYPFLDIPTVGWASALTTVGIFLVAYLLVGTVFVWLSRSLDPTRRQA